VLRQNVAGAGSYGPDLDWITDISGGGTARRTLNWCWRTARVYPRSGTALSIAWRKCALDLGS